MAMNTTDFIVPIMLGVLFALLMALALWFFVDLPCSCQMKGDASL